jgi:endonuclease YncB( thermonuclease family)
MRRWRRQNSLLSGRFGWVIVVVVFGLAALIAARLEPVQTDLSGRAYVADGDTLHLNGQRVRLLGIDAPELNQICWDQSGASWPCGRRARDRLSSLIAKATIACHPSGHDKYGRVLASCDANGADIGAVLMREGLAVSYDGYKAEEATARRAKLGMWQGRFETPRQWRKEEQTGPVEPNLIDRIKDFFR